MILVLYPDNQWIVEKMRMSSDPTYSQLADITISLNNDLDDLKTDALV